MNKHEIRAELLDEIADLLPSLVPFSGNGVVQLRRMAEAERKKAIEGGGGNSWPA